MKDDRDLAPEFETFYDFTRRGELRFPHCGACGRFHWYPMKRCPHCRSERIAWRLVSGWGRLFTWTIVRHAFDPAFAHQLPFVVGLVEFEDAPGVRLVTNIVDVPQEAVRIGMDLEPVFEATNEPHPRVTFRPPQAADRAA